MIAALMCMMLAADPQPLQITVVLAGPELGMGIKERRARVLLENFREKQGWEFQGRVLRLEEAHEEFPGWPISKRMCPAIVIHRGEGVLAVVSREVLVLLQKVPEETDEEKPD